MNTYHGGLFVKTLALSKENIFFGYGVRKYRNICVDRDLRANVNNSSNFYYKGNLYKFYCSTHPHNIYLEILVETGIIGLILVLFFIFYYFKEIMIKNHDPTYKSLIITSLGLFFPFVSTGSFFSSQYFIYFFFIIIFSLNFKDKRCLKII